jgi:Mrp family chromosome partitioning ATPase
MSDKDAADDDKGDTGSMPGDIEESEDPFSTERRYRGMVLRKLKKDHETERRIMEQEAPAAAGGAAAKGMRFHARVLATFMFKGGVHKTTTTIHAAEAIAGSMYDSLDSCTHP